MESEQLICSLCNKGYELKLSQCTLECTTNCGVCGVNLFNKS